MKRTTSALGAILAVLILAACAGDDGDDDSAAAAPADAAPADAAPADAGAGFTSFNDVTAPTTVTMLGASQQVAVTVDANDQITNVGQETAFQTGASVTFTLDTAEDITALTFNSAGGTTLSFGAADPDPDLFAPGIIGARTANDSGAGLLADPDVQLWNFQTFGAWLTADAAGNATLAAQTMGATTGGAAVPTTGTGNYVGVTGGAYSDAAGTFLLTTSNMAATTDFAARTITFATTGTQTGAPFVTLPPLTANANLDLTGNLTYAAGSNQFTGNVTTVGGGVGNAAMAGTASGLFYGPAAEEIGGTFTTRGAGVTFYGGGFGGRR